MAQTFILSDESVNSHGFIVKTNGIDTSRFAKNPIMLYNHSREQGIIGRWENIRVEGSQLLADAVFDENDALGAMIKTKVETGFINSVSIGIENIEDSVENGVKTVFKSVLFEVSIVDIPANPNAVKVAGNGEKALFLSFSRESLKNQLVKLLKLSKNTSDYEVVNKIKEIAKTQENQIDEALRLGLIDSTQQQLIAIASKNNPFEVSRILEECKDNARKETTLLLVENCRKGKFAYTERRIFEEIGEKMGLAKLKKLLEIIPERKSLMSQIDSQNERKNWTLADYRKNAPEELKNNPQLYQMLVNQERKNK